VSKKWFLAVWAAGMMFPVAWVSQQWPQTQAIFNRVFASEWVHVVAHVILYGVLSSTLYLMFPVVRNDWRALLLLFSFLTVFAVLQEGIQVFAIGAGFSNEEWFDLRIDLISSIASIVLTDMYLNARPQMPIKVTNK
jgi:VanZ family protein